MSILDTSYFNQFVVQKEYLMKNKLNLALLSVTKINRQHVQLFFVILSLVMLAIGAGAPEDGGGGYK